MTDNSGAGPQSRWRLPQIQFEFKFNVLALVALVVSGAGFVLTLWLNFRGPDIDIVDTGQVYIAADRSNGADVPIVILDEIVLFNRAPDTNADLVTDYEMTLRLRDGRSICVSAMTRADVAFRPQPAALTQSNVGTPIECPTGGCLSYAPYRVDRLQAPMSGALRGRSATTSSIEFDLLPISACDESSSAAISGLTYEELVQAIAPEAHVRIRAIAYVDRDNRYECRISINPDHVDEIVAGRIASSVCTR